jgi:ubiquinone/menaquinone biosynthesis C-methylase UbiE
MDVRDLKFDSEMFDFIVDKSTIDAILCGECSFINVAKMLKEVDRVLATGGIYMVISYGQPENRIFHFEREFLNFDVTIYTIKKDYNLDEDEVYSKEKFEKVSKYTYNT